MTDLIESEDELLDPRSGPAAAAPPHRLAAVLHRLRERIPLAAAREADPERRRRRTRAGLLALALVAGAGATGVAVHSRDIGHARARTQDRMLLHVLGGGATLSLGGINGSGSSTGSVIGQIPGHNPLSAYFTVTLRNDGVKPLEVTGIRIAVPGVAVLDPAPHTTLAPGDTEALTSKVGISCDAADLPEYPSGVTATVRTPAAGGKAAGAPTTVPLAFDPGHPALPASGTGPAAASIEFLGAADVLQLQSYATASFYRLCGDVLASVPSQVSATAVAGSPSPRNPVVSYSLHIDPGPGSDADAARMAVPLPNPPTIPGMSAQTDLSGPEQIGSEGLDVTVTDRITDCSALGDYLAVRGGAAAATAELNTATPIGLQPVDPRFRTTPTQVATAASPVFGGLTPGTADLQSALLAQLASVCPDL